MFKAAKWQCGDGVGLMAEVMRPNLSFIPSCMGEYGLGRSASVRLISLSIGRARRDCVLAWTASSCVSCGWSGMTAAAAKSPCTRLTLVFLCVGHRASLLGDETRGREDCRWTGPQHGRVEVSEDIGRIKASSRFDAPILTVESAQVAQICQRF